MNSAKHKNWSKTRLVHRFSFYCLRGAVFSQAKDDKPSKQMKTKSVKKLVNINTGSPILAGVDDCQVSYGNNSLSPLNLDKECAESSYNEWQKKDTEEEQVRETV